jgi:hypothetical protein
MTFPIIKVSSAGAWQIWSARFPMIVIKLARKRYTKRENDVAFIFITE